jgi:formylglycine-generating enzyme required for sulfatase activity
MSRYDEPRLQRFQRAVFQHAWLGDDVGRLAHHWSHREKNPDAFLVESRKFTEKLLSHICDYYKIRVDSENPTLQSYLEKILKNVEKVRLTSGPNLALNTIQRLGNQGAHQRNQKVTESELNMCLNSLCTVLEWAQEVAPLKLLEPERSPWPLVAAGLGLGSLVGVALGVGVALVVFGGPAPSSLAAPAQPELACEPCAECAPSAPDTGAALASPQAPKVLALASRQEEAPPQAPPAGAPRVRVKGGPAWRGHDEGEARHTPRHRVEVGTFDLDAHEVTVARYQACVQEKRCKPPAKVGERCNWGRAGREQHPINCVSWAQARNFCLAQGGRLPTEAEWEKAARGESGQAYPWGEAAPAPSLAVYGQKERGTEAVGERPAGVSPFGAQDMAGNVWEWVEDVFWEAAYREGSEADRRCWRCGEKGGTRVYRGGSFGSDPAKLQLWLRKGMQGGEADEGIGVRCAYDDEGGAAAP